MKIVRIIGGLGNQMFQYALLISLQEIFNEKVYVDISKFRTYKLHNGCELDLVFGLNMEQAPVHELKKLTRYTSNYKVSRFYRKIFPPKRTEYIEPKGCEFVCSVLTDGSDKYYDGYWQNCLYFNKYKSIIYEKYTFRNKLNSLNMRIYNDIIINKTSVSIHVRRGDYLENSAYLGICDYSYYKKAIEYVQKKIETPYFYIFSNDINWCQEYITPLIDINNATFVNWNLGKESYIDMQLMSNCRINIIANSSFSWWAAYLNKSNNKIVIAPRKWINNNFSDVIQLPEWILL